MHNIFIQARHPLLKITAEAKIVSKFEKEGFYPLFRVVFGDGYNADFLQSECEVRESDKPYLDTIPTHSDRKGDMFATGGIAINKE